MFVCVCVNARSVKPSTAVRFVYVNLTLNVDLSVPASTQDIDALGLRAFNSQSVQPLPFLKIANSVSEGERCRLRGRGGGRETKADRVVKTLP